MKPENLDELAELADQAGFPGLADTAKNCAAHWRADIRARDEAHADVLHLRQAIGEAATLMEAAVQP